MKAHVKAHVKAHEYGSVYESSFAWPEVWSDVDTAIAGHRRREDELGVRLAAALDDAELARPTQRLYAAEPAAPGRPHAYTPHTGLLGSRPAGWRSASWPTRASTRTRDVRALGSTEQAP